MFPAHLSDLSDPYGLPGGYTPYGQRPPSAGGHYGDADMSNSTLNSGATTPTGRVFTPSTTAAGSMAGDDWDDGPDTSIGPLHTCPSCRCRPLTLFSDADGPFDCEQLRGGISNAASVISNAEVAISRKSKVASTLTEEEKDDVRVKKKEIAEARTEMLAAYYQLDDLDVPYGKYIDQPMSTVKPWPSLDAKQDELVSLMTKGNGLPRDLKSAYTCALQASEKMPSLNKRFGLASLISNASGGTSTPRR